MKVKILKKEYEAEVIQIEHENIKIQISCIYPEVLTITEIGRAINKIASIPIATNCIQLKVI